MKPISLSRAERNLVVAIRDVVAAGIPKDRARIKTSEACKLLSCSRATFNRVYRPKLSAIKNGSHNVYLKEEVENL